MNSSFHNNVYSGHLITIFSLLLLSLACSLTTPPVNSANSNFIQTQPTARIANEIETPTSKPITCIVTAHVLQLRECAGVSCTVKDWLNHGEVLSVQQNINGWYQVTTSAEESGWVNSKYCGGL